MPVSRTTKQTTITTAPNPAAARQAQEPQWMVRPPIHLHPHRDSDHDATALHWQALADAGLIPVLSSVEGGGNPPVPPAIAAQREANDALFHGFAHDLARSRDGACA